MSEDEARAWIEAKFDVPRETMARLDLFAALIRDESQRQNLVSRATIDSIWERHFLDSAQLLRWAPSPTASWVDLGSGAGFPGVIVALLHGGPVTLVEERRLRVEFLRMAVEALNLGGAAEVVGRSIERVQPRSFDVISARALAPLPKLLDIGQRFSTNKTRWILPKGRNARSELAAAGPSWQGDFRIEPSLTDPEAGIIVAEGVERKSA